MGYSLCWLPHIPQRRPIPVSSMSFSTSTVQIIQNFSWNSVGHLCFHHGFTSGGIFTSLCGLTLACYMGSVVVTSLSSGLPDPCKTWQTQRMVISPNCYWLLVYIRYHTLLRDSVIPSNREESCTSRSCNTEDTHNTFQTKTMLSNALPYQGQSLIDKASLQFCFSQMLLYYPTLSYYTKILLSPGASGLCCPDRKSVV